MKKKIELLLLKRILILPGRILGREEIKDSERICEIKTSDPQFDPKKECVSCM